ncbi:ABC transporter ATP-binding protein [Haloglomus halophilum]|uniref:ABC transporter ATP-binding protein n=1 Tax=Haloglomus halophilum TaxID=2962672 RepID=UPI0020C94245|nr:ABC transporter ATP-binding protein [Haloglomus halophilum]
MPNIVNKGDGLESERRSTDGESEVVLQADGLAKAYGSSLPFRERVEVLTGTDLTVRAGELVGVVGANGSGKSTLLRILVGDLAADDGTVRVSGRVGWCPQETRLYDRLTVRETFALFGEAYGLDDEAVAEARDRLADRLDFERYLDRRIDRLSGGNRQKVNLAVALLHDPDVLVLDEPYTGFDWETYLAFWELTDDLRDRGTAIVIVSHFVEERERFDRVLELADGELHADDGAETDARPEGTEVAASRREAATDGGTRGTTGVRFDDDR